MPEKKQYDNVRVPDYNTLPGYKYDEWLARQLASKRLIEGKFPDTQPLVMEPVLAVVDTTPNGPEGVEFWYIENDFVAS